MEARLRPGVLGLPVFCAAVWLYAWCPAAAQGWPEKTIRFISPVSAGTAQDTSIRLVADRLTQSLGRSVIDNMPGGRGLIAAQTAARAVPDGYTYFLGGVGVIAADRHLFKSLPYNPDSDFVPVAMIYDAAAFVVAVHPDVPAKSVPELITLAKSQPRKLNCGTGMVGVLAMLGLWFNNLFGTELVAVLYNNSAQMMQDALAGRTQMLFTTIGAVEPFHRTGKLRVLGVYSIKRFPGLEQVPTIVETLPGYDIVGIGILMAPTGTPVAILQRLNREIDRIVRDQDFNQRLIGLGMTTAGAGTLRSLVEFMRAQRENWDRMFSQVQIAPQ